MIWCLVCSKNIIFWANLYDLQIWLSIRVLGSVVLLFIFLPTSYIICAKHQWNSTACNYSHLYATGLLPRERKGRKTCPRAFCPFEIEMKKLMHEGEWKQTEVPSSLLGKYDPLCREVTLRPDVNASVFFSSYKYFKSKHLFMEAFVSQVGHCQYVLFNLISAGKPTFFRLESSKRLQCKLCYLCTCLLRRHNFGMSAYFLLSKYAQIQRI